MVGHWGMKEKEAFGTDVSHSPFQAESDDQNCFICWRSNCSVYCLINEVLWSCACFHYHHWRHYCDQEWKCEARSSVWLVLRTTLSFSALSFPECNVLWRRMSCSLLCTSMPLSIQAAPPAQQSVPKTFRESVWRCLSAQNVYARQKAKEYVRVRQTVWETVWDFRRNLLCVKRSEWTVFVLLEWKLKYPTKSLAEPWPIGSLSLYLLQMSLHPS